jgi:uncharacterized membrane protein YfcA
MIVITKWIIILFGVFFIFAGIIMLIKPKTARATLQKAGSTNFINYAEITIRMIPAIALIIYADYSKFPEAFKIAGWFMLITSLALYLVPRPLHHRFSLKSAEVLQPLCFQFISPFSVLIGIIIIYSVI